MRAYNMVNTAGYYAINTGGQVKAFSDNNNDDDGREIVEEFPDGSKKISRAWKEQPEKSWQRKEREMTDRARTYFPNVRESVLERELWNQVTGDNRTVPNVSPRLAVEYRAYQARLNREDLISRQLFDQINAQ